MPRRLAPASRPVQLIVDGDRVVAEEGEPVAIALAAAGRTVLGRSVKYHRPRGAVCYAGRCDGCIMRVDGVQSVMTCRVPATDGMRIETQNVVGSARRDLLAATDWFFPDGMNHHEMFTWNEQVNKVMQKIARRIAGIGELPDATHEPRAAREEEIDVLVIGAGPAGLEAAIAAAEAATSASVLVLEEEPHAGGVLRWWPGAVRTAAGPKKGADVVRQLLGRAGQLGVRVLTRAGAVAAYEPWEDVGGADGEAPSRRAHPAVVVAQTPDHLLRLHAKEIVIATGRHEGASAFAGADRPGVLTVRGACTLLAHGVLPGERVLLAGAHPALRPLAVALEAAGADVLGPFEESALREAKGRPEVSKCEVEGEGTLECDAIVVASPTSAVYELAAQLGVPVPFDGRGFELGAPPPDVRVVGWAAGFPGGTPLPVSGLAPSATPAR